MWFFVLGRLSFEQHLIKGLTVLDQMSKSMVRLVHCARIESSEDEAHEAAVALPCGSG